MFKKIKSNLEFQFTGNDKNVKRRTFFFLSPLLLDTHILHETTLDLPLWLKYNGTLKSAAWPEALCQGVYSWRDSVHRYRGKLSSSKSTCPLHPSTDTLPSHRSIISWRLKSWKSQGLCSWIFQSSGKRSTFQQGLESASFLPIYLTIAPICGNNLHTCQKLRFKKRFRNFPHKCPPCQKPASKYQHSFLNIFHNAEGVFLISW